MEYADVKKSKIITVASIAKHDCPTEARTFDGICLLQYMYPYAISTRWICAIIRAPPVSFPGSGLRIKMSHYEELANWLYQTFLLADMEVVLAYSQLGAGNIENKNGA